VLRRKRHFCLLGTPFAIISHKRTYYPPTYYRESRMADSIKDELEDAGHKIAETATKVGH
jgi:hypothetical protein